jgi:hypothetical protein
MTECCMRECVFEEGGATQAAAVATCAQVLVCVARLVGGTALRSRDACRFCWRLRLDDFATDVVGLWLGSVMVGLWGALIGLTVGISVDLLGIGVCGCMYRVIHLLSLL